MGQKGNQLNLLNEKFLGEVSQSEAMTFLGVCKVLGVGLIRETKDPKTFTEILEETMDKFDARSRKRKRELLEVLRDANRAKDK